jgi:hypothetical protein
VHQSDIDSEGFPWREATKVTYEEESGDKGPKTVRVKAGLTPAAGLCSAGRAQVVKNQ